MTSIFGTYGKIYYMMEQNVIQTGLNGLPPVKEQYNENEKKLIAEAADKYGARPVATAYGLKWQAVVAWKKHYGTKAKQSVNQPKKSAARIVIQSQFGQEITMDKLLEKVGTAVDAVYIRADEGKAYWVQGEENGAVELW